MKLFVQFLVGGGSLFSASSTTTGSAQGIALGLVPVGLTPVAFFPPTATQTLQAISVIFREAPVQNRIKRSLKHEKGGYHGNYKLTYAQLAKKS